MSLMISFQRTIYLPVKETSGSKWIDHSTPKHLDNDLNYLDLNMFSVIDEYGWITAWELQEDTF